MLKFSKAACALLAGTLLMMLSDAALADTLLSGTIDGVSYANATSVPLVPEGYTVIKYVSSEASGNPWASNTVGPYIKLTNADNSNFQPEGTDTVEVKYAFTTQLTSTEKSSCWLFCTRESGNGKFSFLRTSDQGSGFRYDYADKTASIPSPSTYNNTSTHIVKVNSSGIYFDGSSTPAVTVSGASAYKQASTPTLLFAAHSDNAGVSTASTESGYGTARIYYFRVLKADGSCRMNLVPMKDANGVAGMYDQVSGQFFTSASSYALTAGGNATLADILESFTPGTDPAATGGDYVLKDGDAYLHVFTSSATLTLSSNATADMLLVGGGGGGGYNAAGGGAGGAVVEIANKSISAGSYAVTVGAGGAHETSQSYIWGGTGGTSSVADIDDASAAGGSGGVGWKGSSDGGDTLRDCAGWGGSNGTSYGAGGGSNTQSNGGDGKASEILGVTIVFGGGGGKGDGTQPNSNFLQGGAGGGGQGACRYANGNSSTAGAGLAKNGTNFLGGGGGGGAGGGQQDQACTSGADGGSGIVVIRVMPGGDDPDDPTVIQIPTGANLVYTGAEQTGVADGTGYELSGTFAATAVGNYTATATLTDATNTKWSDETTEPKTINWSIAKATPVISGTLTMAGWTEGETASEPSGLSATFGTVVYAYYSDQACTASIAKPTTAGTYYVRGEVAADTNWNAANSAAVSFTITTAGGITTYYKVGSDGSGDSSFGRSYSSTSGWSATQGGTVDESHTVSSGNDYIVPTGTELRTPAQDADDTFAGKSLTLAGGTLTLKRATYATQGTKTVTVQQLVLTDGGVIRNASDKTDFTLAGTSVTIPSGKTGAIEITGGNRRGIIVGSALAGSGTLQLTWQGAGSAPSGQDDYLKLAGDNSGFTGTITAVGDTSVAGTKYTLVLDGKFGGTITSLPKAKTNSIKVNYGNNAGLTVATTTIPAALKTDLVFYGSAGFTTPDLPLITFPAGTSVDPTAFTIKHASSESGGATAFTGLDTVENGNGTITLVANHGSAPVAADATLNFASTAKTIRPALHGCGVAPRTRALGKSSETQILKDAGFYTCRAHDLALHDGAQAIVDFQQIFPLFSKDPEDPRSYRFEPTDRVMSAITNAGMKIVFRLGSCGQSHGDDTHEYFNNIFTPSSASYDKIAAVFSKIIAHYNEGWNNGFNLGIEYWEIWNEPDADPGNRWPSSSAASEFPQLFAKVVKKVKTDHPSVKVGGPASFQLNTGFFDSCLNACNSAGACPDFYTFHYYSHYCGAAKDPGDLTAAVENMRSHLASKTCAGKSCADIEIGVTEWNYYSGPSTEWYGRLTMEGAAWCAGVAQDLQYSSADFSNWYGAGWNASFGIYNGRDGVLSKTYYSLKMVGKIVNGYTKLAARTDTDTLHVLGAVNDDGTKGCVMVTDRTATARNLTVGLSGFTGKTLSNIRCYVTDDTRDMAEVTTGFTLQANAPSSVTLTKGATRSVWLITFDIAE